LKLKKTRFKKKIKMTDAQAKKPGEKEGKNIVHEQAILVETIRKELREQRLYENFSINPFTKSKNCKLFV
jgi:hypothetical protein